MKFPFEVPFSEVKTNIDEFVDAVFSCLESEFMAMPKGKGFITYSQFVNGYESLKHSTSGFRDICPKAILKVAFKVPVSILVLRSMLGFTPPEWAYITTQRTGIDVSQSAVRTIDRKIRLAPMKPLHYSGVSQSRILALIETACRLLNEKPPRVRENQLHRLHKADTQNGADGICRLADIGVPYAMLLYERFLGRPFASHRDSVSELIGDILENSIESVLVRAGVSFRKTKRAEKVPGFDQTPDFIIPDEFNPRVVIEAKITEDDGTARDKVTRIQHLASLSHNVRLKNIPDFEVIACIGGRGFGIRREDMKKLILATRGKVFTSQNLEQLISCTKLELFQTIFDSKE